MRQVQIKGLQSKCYQDKWNIFTPESFLSCYWRLQHEKVEAARCLTQGWFTLATKATEAESESEESSDLV